MVQKQKSNLALTEANNRILTDVENQEPDPTKRNTTWRKNNFTIKHAVAKLILKNGCWPSAAEIVEETGLARCTVYKHLQNLNKQEMMKDELEELRLKRSYVMAKVAVFSMDGDIKAMRMFFRITRH